MFLTARGRVCPEHFMELYDISDESCNTSRHAGNWRNFASQRNIIGESVTKKMVWPKRALRAGAHGGR